ncbi:adenylate/guanylate cyclase domain-containing protein [Paenibacillus roseipurpureus]|uniref:Adenylate/guanylate cyclase domain-containing protein n=1 Tax=Paenibacillus roseopurpureus TaxID=2918901 RepID=A0AA96LQT3_9BACL|nr:adenylate/guanylate cyclase domain-containing protein [Paenibacillus sp. MBLB1832]WNR44876.1 adenylate/guanylate cyclase domain-containing protein [Paenibacillus sp. MBLB1832]
MSSLPQGIVTFVFTDIEGSTKLWEAHPVEMQEALRQHDEILTTNFEEHGGIVVKHRGEGDSFFVVFTVASHALQAAAAVQKKLAETAWPIPQPICVRMAVHSGEAELRDGDYYGVTVNRCARLRSIAHGGQVVVSTATVELARVLETQELQLINLGTHRLKDIATPEQVFQLTSPGLKEEFPPLRSLQGPVNPLPIQVTPFIGREQELSELHERLTHTRLLSVLGPGGAGKTRLAIQLANEAMTNYPDGVWLVELAPIQEPSLLYQTVAAVFGLKEGQQQSIKEALIEYLGTKKLLLVLDNCEHLIDASAQLAAHLLQTCPQLQMIVTSREPLTITGETLWRIPSLSLPNPEEQHSVEQLLAYEAVRLFVDRAQAVQASFTVTKQNAAAVADICARLDGIPLALELAAARVKALSVEQIAARLAESFRLLSGGDRTRLPRQQTLRALMDWSYQLLNESERMLWRRLSVFAGSFSLEAAEAVSSGDGVDDFEIVDILSQLVDKSLVQSEGRDGEVRYRLLTTIRQYGQEKLLEAGEQEERMALFCAYYVTFIEHTAGGMHTPHMQGSTVKEWTRELSNLRVAMDWSQQSAASQPNMMEQAGRLISATDSFWSMLGITREGHDRLQIWLEGPQSRDFPHTRVHALLTAVNMTYLVDQQRAIAYIQEALSLANSLGEPSLQAKALYYMALGCHVLGQYQQAVALFDQAYVILKSLNADWQISSLLRFKAIALVNQSQDAEARLIIEEGLQLCRRLGDPHEEAALFRMLGSLALNEGRVDEAKRYYRESMVTTCELADKMCTLSGLGGVSLIAEAMGEAQLAAWLGGAYKELSTSIGGGMNVWLHRSSADIWAALETEQPAAWSSGREAGYDEAIARARAVVAEG